jgi:hypothetical protein
LLWQHSRQWLGNRNQFPCPSPLSAPIVPRSTQEIPSVRSTTIRPGVRGGQKAIGTVVATTPAPVILFIRRQGHRLFGRYHTQTRAGSSYPRAESKPYSFRSVRHKFDLSYPPAARNRRATKQERDDTGPSAPRRCYITPLSHHRRSARLTISEHIESAGPKPAL